MSLKSTFKRFFDLEEETMVPTDNDDNTTERFESSHNREDRKVIEKGGRIVALQNVHQQGKVVLVEPKSFEEVQEFVGYLKSRQTVICSLQSIDKASGQRVLDFMGGTLFALDGQVRKIGKDTFLFAPDHIDISGMISDWKTEN
ncbi:cell division protein SepF [Sporolactobacillus spathodeae]|uniref:Cell division protein SepF n=1 Tax=Sporolactobacillus spathodeae TaxID=1465502 RepID=A0ABS2Q919_9BACL|nr:cell division protein SepF [Sporolactobacillus spathodeae]MBM7658278.1 cell division inhibitor SepF [Sporolactobacillus spathodeae]